MKNILLVGVSGLCRAVKIPDYFSLEWVSDLIGCDWVEIVHPMRLPKGYVLLVDEEGLLKQYPTINIYGSWMYKTDEHGQPIVGNIVIMKEDVGPDGVELVGMESEEIDGLVKEFMENRKEWTEKVLEKLRADGVMASDSI